MSSEIPSPEPRPAGAPALAVALAAAATATLLIAAWLVFTATTVLRQRDPAHVTVWLWIACGFAVFALASWVAVRPGPASIAARVVTALLGVPAAGLGLGTTARVLSHGGQAGHFEGYLVLMALVLAAHGLIAIAYALLAPLPARAPRAA